MKLKWVLIFYVFISYSQLNVIAGGIDYSPFFGAKTLSLNGLYFAGNDGLSCSLTNPAGFSLLKGMSLQATILDRLGLQEFNSPDLGLYRSFRHDALSFGGGGYWNVSPLFTAAISYGRIIDYSVNWPFAKLASDNSTILAFDMNNNFHVDAISPSAAFRFGNFSFGATLDIYKVELNSAFPQANLKVSSSSDLEAYQFNVNQKVWTYGFNFGAIADLSQEFRIGIALKSSYKANLSGTANSKMFQDTDSASYQTNVSSTFQMPWSIGAGILYQLEPGLKINIDAQYNLWGSIQNNINLKYGDQIWQNELSHVDSISGIQGNKIELAYNNTFDFGVGIEYMADEDTYLRAGYRFSQMPNSNSTYSFLMPGVNNHSLSLGIGIISGEYTLDAGLVYSFGISKDVSRNVYSKFSGKYNADSYIPSITLRYSL